MIENEFDLGKARVWPPEAKIGHPLLVKFDQNGQFSDFWSTLGPIFTMKQLLRETLRVVFRWSKDLLRRPNNQNDQIEKSIFGPYLHLLKNSGS